MCLETAGRLILKGAASSFTEASPCDSRASIARRVGSDKALNTAFSASVSETVMADMVYLLAELINIAVKYKSSKKWCQAGAIYRFSLQVFIHAQKAGKPWLTAGRDVSVSVGHLGANSWWRFTLRI